MNTNDLEETPSFRSRVISKAEKFNSEHKGLSQFGLFYAITAITLHNIFFCFFQNNIKKIVSIAGVTAIFALSSSFSYPAPVPEVSLAEAEVPAAGTDISGEESSVNPDVAEIEDMVSVTDILEDQDYSSVENESDAVTAKEPISTKITGDTDKNPVFEADDWRLILVNKQHPIPDDYKFTLGDIGGGMKCDERVVGPLRDMLSAAKDDGVSLIVCSPYRDMDRQTMLFTNKVKRYMKTGMSYMDAYTLASQAVTVPGSSEHQIGLAVDFITDGYTLLDEGFSETAAGKWLAENSYRFGFILRYPAGKEEITSIEYEPWHFRYVGEEAATFITHNRLCLEEFCRKYVK